MKSSAELRQQAAQIRERQKALVDTAEAEKRDMTQEEWDNFRSANADIDTLNRNAQEMEIYESTRKEDPERRSAHAMEKAELTPQGPQRAKLLRNTDEYRNAFLSYMIAGDGGLFPQERSLLGEANVLGMDISKMTANERRALGVGNVTGAGYLVPETFEARIMQNMLAFGGMREVATIVSTSGGEDMSFPVSDDTSNTGELLAEHSTASEQDVTVGLRTLKAFVYGSKVVRVSKELLQDAAFDIESWLAGVLAERIGRITNTHFTVGVGPSQPSGIVGDAGTGVTGAAGSASSVSFDDLISLEHSIDPAYRTRGGRYMFADSTLLYLRKIKDGNGQYIWQQAVTAGAPNTVNGYPYTINQDMAAMAANANSILFGNLAQYTIRDVVGIQLVRLDELYALQRQSAFVAFSRHDGALFNAGTNPVKLYVNGAS